MKRRHLELGQQLSSIPVRNEKVKVHRGDDGNSIEIEVELRYRQWMLPLTKLLNMRHKKRFLLDGVGQEVYESIDGKKSFEKLIDDFAERHKLTFFESRALLMHYIQILTKRGLIVIGVKTP